MSNSAIQTPYIPFGSAASSRNKIINGCMRLAQRGTSIACGQVAAPYTLDRWNLSSNHSAGDITVTQDTSTPNSNFQYSLKATNAAGNDTSVGAADYCMLRAKIEGYNLVPLRSGNITISFWVRSSKTGTYCVGLNGATYTRSYVAEYTINAANTWEYKQITIDLSVGISSGTWDYTNGIGMVANFTLMCGTDSQATVNTWGSGLKVATASQVNWLNETNTFYITGVQLEAGSAATDFEVRDYGTELRHCQRYHQRIGFTNSGWLGYLAYTGAGGDNYGHLITYPVAMRAPPVISISGTWAVNNCAQPTTVSVGPDCFMLRTVPSGAGRFWFLDNSVDDGIIAEAEL